MKNELGDLPKIDLDDSVSKEDEILVKNKEDNRETVKNNKAKEKVKKEKTFLSKNEKTNKILTIILVIALVFVFIILLGFGIKKVIDYYNNKNIQDKNSDLSSKVGIDKGPGESDFIDGLDYPIETEDPDYSTSKTGNKKVYYKGFEVVGYIRIPKINIVYPILIPMTNKSLEASVVQEYTINGINKPGNTTLSGHNYKNEQFFSNLYKLQVGDIIYIKDMDGKELKYDIYDIQELDENDKSFVQRNTNNNIEISLSTCTDNVINRIVVFASNEIQKDVE